MRIRAAARHQIKHLQNSGVPLLEARRRVFSTAPDYAWRRMVFGRYDPSAEDVERLRDAAHAPVRQRGLNIPLGYDLTSGEGVVAHLGRKAWDGERAILHFTGDPAETTTMLTAVVDAISARYSPDDVRIFTLGEHPNPRVVDSVSMGGLYADIATTQRRSGALAVVVLPNLTDMLAAGESASVYLWEAMMAGDFPDAVLITADESDLREVRPGFVARIVDDLVLNQRMFVLAGQNSPEKGATSWLYPGQVAAACIAVEGPGGRLRGTVGNARGPAGRRIKIPVSRSPQTMLPLEPV